MAECSEIEAGGEVRTIKDATARSGVAANTQAIAAINEKIPASASSSNKMATAADIPNITPLQQSVAAINEKIPANASASNKMATASDIPNITPLQQSVAAIEEKIPANASASNKMATASDIPNITPLQQSVAAINEKIPANASASNKMATASDIPNITPLEQSIQTLGLTKLQAGGGVIVISNQFQWLHTEANAVRYTNNTGRPILVTGLFLQGAQAYTTTMKDDGTTIAEFSNLTGRTDFTFTLTAVVKAGGVLAVYNNKPEEDGALLCSLTAQVC